MHGKAKNAHLPHHAHEPTQTSARPQIALEKVAAASSMAVRSVTQSQGLHPREVAAPNMATNQTGRETGHWGPVTPRKRRNIQVLPLAKKKSYTTDTGWQFWRGPDQSTTGIRQCYGHTHCPLHHGKPQVCEDHDFIPQQVLWCQQYHQG